MKPIRRDYPIEEYLDDLAGSGVTRSVYVQTNWANDRFEQETAWVQETADRHGWPHAIVSFADFNVEDVRPQLDRLARYQAGAGRAHATALAREPAVSLCGATRSLRGSENPAQHRTPRRLRLEL